VPDYRNSTARSLEIGLVFAKHPEDKDYLLHKEHIFIFSAITHTPTSVLKSSSHPPPSQKKIPTTHFHSQQCSCSKWLYMWIKQKQFQTILDTVVISPITDMQTYKSHLHILLTVHLSIVYFIFISNLIHYSLPVDCCLDHLPYGCPLCRTFQVCFVTPGARLKPAQTAVLSQRPHDKRHLQR
jgi:hypothetical protein